MTVSYTDSGFLLILDPGDEVVRSLIQFAREHEIEDAVVTGTGILTEVELGAGSGRGRGHRRIRLAEPSQVCSLAGAVTLVDGEPLPHLHASFAQTEESLPRGHVYQAVCSTTMAIAVRLTGSRVSGGAELSPAQIRTRTAL